MPTVTSKDKTKIAFQQTGSGAPLILVNGALGDRMLDQRFKMMGVLAELLAPSHTVIGYDRRRRGESNEAGPFSVEREIEDIAALIEAAGGSAALFGFSSGGALALRAAGAGIGVERVAAYETPFVVKPDDKHPSEDYGTTLDELIAADKRGAAVQHFMRQAMGMPAPAVVLMRLMPGWKQMCANAPTLRYDWAALGAHNMKGAPLDPAEWRTVTVPALILFGGKSPSSLKNGARALAEVLPDAQLQELEGVGHRLKVALLAPVLRDFLASEPEAQPRTAEPV